MPLGEKWMWKNQEKPLKNLQTFKQEITDNGFDIVESGITHSELDYVSILLVILYNKITLTKGFKTES